MESWIWKLSEEVGELLKNRMPGNLEQKIL